MSFGTTEPLYARNPRLCPAAESHNISTRKYLSKTTPPDQPQRVPDSAGTRSDKETPHLHQQGAEAAGNRLTPA